MLEDTSKIFAKNEDKLLSRIKKIVFSISIILYKNFVYYIFCICMSRSSIIGEMFPCVIAFLCAYFYLKGPSFVILSISLISIISVKFSLKYILLCCFIYVYYLSIRKKKKSNIFIDILCFAVILFTVNTIILLDSGFSLKVMFINICELFFIISCTFIIREVIIAVRKRHFGIDAMACLLAVIFIAVLGLREIHVLNFSIIMFTVFFTIIFVSAYISPMAGMILGFAFGLFNFSNVNESAYYMLALGFGGVCCGIVNNKYKIFSGFIFGILSTLILLYFNNISLYKQYTKEIIISIFIFTITSFCFKEKLLKLKYFDDFYRNKNTNIANKLNNLSSAINELNDVYFSNKNSKVNRDYNIESCVNNVYSKVCINCPNISKCWNLNHNKTYYGIVKIASNINNNKSYYEGYIKNKCIHYRDIIKEIYKIVKKEEFCEQKEEINNRELVQHLKETSNIIRNTVKEIEYTDINSVYLKQTLNENFKDNNILIKSLEVVEYQKCTSIIFTVTTELSMDEICLNITNTLNSTTGYYMKCTEKIVSHDKKYILRFSTLEKISASAYYAKITKEDSEISGDNYEYGVSDNKFYGILSDGMGTGKQACKESKEALKLLVKLMNANFNELQVLNTVNSLLFMNLQDDRYVTLDLSIVDYEKNKLRLYKAGAAETYVIRNGGVAEYRASSLPIGILEEIEFYKNEIDIRKDDIIVMFTDGVIDSINLDYSKSIQEYLKFIAHKSPQKIANDIITYAIKGLDNVIDDMTVLIIKIF